MTRIALVRIVSKTKKIDETKTLISDQSEIRGPTTPEIVGLKTIAKELIR